jgi:aspartate/methionine/tyrosine aminotransferase
MFSHRLPRHTESNQLTRRLEAMRVSGVDIVDLTGANPTRAAIDYPRDLLAQLADARSLDYDPHPFGLPATREAVAADHLRRGARVDPSQVVLTASTSEAYTWLFKLLCDPGESVLVPRPSYPLFEHLTRLEGVRAEPYDLEYHGRWEIDFATIEQAPADARALLVVTPNNPTGSYVTASDTARLSALCRERGWALVADEVFADYPVEAVDPFTDLAPRADGCLTFSLGGLSKSLGLPQLKLGWIVVGGSPPLRDAALSSLEIIADSFLSVSTPIQIAAPDILARAGVVREAIRARVRDNLASLRRLAADFPAVEVLRVDGGWSAVIRLPATRGEEQFVLDLLERERILVHPGYFFDFNQEAYVVVSLLLPRDQFDAALPRLMRAGTF